MGLATPTTIFLSFHDYLHDYYFHIQVLGYYTSKYLNIDLNIILGEIHEADANKYISIYILYKIYRYLGARRKNFHAWR